MASSAWFGEEWQIFSENGLCIILECLLKLLTENEE
jgi:hypothetical protein